MNKIIFVLAAVMMFTVTSNAQALTLQYSVNGSDFKTNTYTATDEVLIQNILFPSGSGTTIKASAFDLTQPDLFDLNLSLTTIANKVSGTTLVVRAFETIDISPNLLQQLNESISSSYSKGIGSNSVSYTSSTYLYQGSTSNTLLIFNKSEGGTEIKALDYSASTSITPNGLAKNATSKSFDPYYFGNLVSSPFTIGEEVSFSFNGSGGTISSYANDIQLTAVPEPGTMMLLGFGMLGLAVYGKRRMNNTEA